MQAGAITGYMDVAQVTLYVFWVFFFGLVIYLRKEDKREGYPLVSDYPGEIVQGFPIMPAPKAFILPHGAGTVYAPRPASAEPSYNAQPVAPWPGAPMQPLGNPMLANAGPSAWALRADVPDLLQETNETRIVPMRLLPEYFLDEESPDPRGQRAVGADGVVGGEVSDIWIDRAEMQVRYLEVKTAAGSSVLVPMPLVRIDASGRVTAESVLGSQFSSAPTLASPDQVTSREEDQIQAYFAGGQLFATPGRMEPLL
jgi:photosynthetic reaction center H subunit